MVPPPEILRNEYEELLHRLSSQVLMRLQNERDIRQRAKIALFPEVLAKLYKQLELFINIAFSETRYHKGNQLRGMYFSSTIPGETPQPSSFGVDLNYNTPSAPSNDAFFIYKLLQESGHT